MRRKLNSEVRSARAAAAQRTAFMTLTENRSMSRILGVYLVKMN